MPSPQVEPESPSTAIVRSEELAEVMAGGGLGQPEAGREVTCADPIRVVGEKNRQQLDACRICERFESQCDLEGSRVVDGGRGDGCATYWRADIDDGQRLRHPLTLRGVLTYVEKVALWILSGNSIYVSLQIGGRSCPACNSL